jgi:hypothetical protein
VNVRSKDTYTSSYSLHWPTSLFDTPKYVSIAVVAIGVERALCKL